MGPVKQPPTSWRFQPKQSSYIGKAGLASIILDWLSSLQYITKEEKKILPQTKADNDTQEFGLLRLAIQERNVYSTRYSF